MKQHAARAYYLLICCNAPTQFVLDPVLRIAAVLEEGLHHVLGLDIARVWPFDALQEPPHPV